jgi:outer membrane lipase/esterase
VTGGVDWTRGNMVYGVFGGVGRNEYSFGGRGGEFDQTDATLGGFIGWYGDAAWVNAQLSYSQVRYDVDRTVYLGSVKRTHSGSPDGSNLTFGVSAGYDFEGERLSHGPVLSVFAQQIDVDGYAESNGTLSTALAYPDQEFDSMIVSAGWQASYKVSDHLAPYARITYDTETEEEGGQAFARVQSIPGSLPYAVPGVEFDDTFVTVQFGARTQVFGLDANIGAAMTTAHGNGEDVTVYATFGKGF